MNDSLYLRAGWVIEQTILLILLSSKFSFVEIKNAEYPVFLDRKFLYCFNSLKTYYRLCCPLVSIGSSAIATLAIK